MSDYDSVNDLNSLFKGLNYSNTNEDSRVEYHECGVGQKILVIADSGCRVIPLLAKRPSHLDLVDISFAQIVFTNLRFYTLDKLNYEEYLDFWGYPQIKQPKDNSYLIDLRKSIIHSFKSEIDGGEKYLNDLFTTNSFSSPLYYGKEEKGLLQNASSNSSMLNEAFYNLLNTSSLTEQRDYYEKSFPSKLFYNKLYKNSKKMEEGNVSHIATKICNEWLQIFSNIITKTKISDNHHAQMILFGKMLTPTALPLSATEEMFFQAKNALSQTTINYSYNNLIDFLKGDSYLFDFFSLSNIVDYLNEQELADMFFYLTQRGTVGSRIVMRHSRSKSISNYKPFWKKSLEFNNFIEEEKTQSFNFTILSKDIHITSDLRESVCRLDF